jgi:hypothetical protein
MLDAQTPPAPPAPASPLSPLAQANDAFRKALGGVPANSGRLVITNGVAARGARFVFAALVAVRNVDSFPAGDDPYGEHDFGAVETGGEKLFWKFDYYEDAACEYGAEKPAEGCYRVLTVMLASEY